MTKLTQAYIKLISELYNTQINPLTPEQEQELEQKLGIYEWDDVRASIQRYFVKNSKTAPNLTQIIALIETNPKVRLKEVEFDETQIHVPLPTTKIWSITQTYDKMINVLVDAGVIPDTHGNYTNTKGLIDPKTDLPILNPYQWIVWQVQDAMKERPDLFAKFPNVTYFEAMAIAIQNGMVKIKVRDWAKAAQKLRPEEKTWAKNPEKRIGSPQTLRQILG